MWGIRNFIHINLYLSLSISHFVIGVDRTEIPGLCHDIAVVRHYLILVAFMWMLMEGVVLYVVLARAFVKKQHHYIVGFFLLSYGLPALYMCLTVPLGLVLGDDEGGWTKFFVSWATYFNIIWTFIIPALLIILISMLINIGFFIMTVWIMYKHARKGTKMSHWLNTSVSLLYVMGTTWFTGVLMFHQALFFVVYIVCKKFESKLLSSIYSSHESRTFTQSSTTITSREGESSPPALTEIELKLEQLHNGSLADEATSPTVSTLPQMNGHTTTTTKQQSHTPKATPPKEEEKELMLSDSNSKAPFQQDRLHKQMSPPQEIEFDEIEISDVATPTTPTPILPPEEEEEEEEGGKAPSSGATDSAPPTKNFFSVQVVSSS